MKEIYRWLEIILAERFGLNLSILKNTNGTLKLGIPTSNLYIILPDINSFFLTNTDMLCAYWDALEENWLPVIDRKLVAPWISSKLPTPLIEKNKEGYTIHYDIFGLMYWMLTRQEEIGQTNLDNYNRFPAIASHAYKNNYLERPIVDEWLHILGQVIQSQWNNVAIKQHCFSIKPSHDVDIPSRFGFVGLKGFIRGIASDILKKGSLESIWIAPLSRFGRRKSIYKKDPYNTFHWIMDISERNELISAFYFICGQTDVSKDADYKLNHPAIRKLMRGINHRGHEIGLHPSYNTYRTPKALKTEANYLKNICYKENIEQPLWGGRMHYLRWEQPTTLQAWEDAGMDYDSSLGYADRIGFRCGTCFEYPGFNAKTGKILNVRIRPLIVMDVTFAAKDYMNLGYSDKALEKILIIKNNCKKVKGVFNILWHNNNFLTKEQKKLYETVVTYEKN